MPNSTWWSHRRESGGIEVGLSAWPPPHLYADEEQAMSSLRLLHGLNLLPQPQRLPKRLLLSHSATFGQLSFNFLYNSGPASVMSVERIPRCSGPALPSSIVPSVMGNPWAALPAWHLISFKPRHKHRLCHILTITVSDQLLASLLLASPSE